MGAGRLMLASDLFMFAGYSERRDEVQSTKRTPTGEKEIGRFASDKLGEVLEVFTSKAGTTGIHLSINWRAFDVKGKKKFSDIGASYELDDMSAILPAKTGTVLEIGRLRGQVVTRQNREPQGMAQRSLESILETEGFLH